MNRGDFVWGLVLFLLSMILVFPAPREGFVYLTTHHGIAMGFVNFAILSTMGELLSSRIRGGRWRRMRGFWLKVALWGVFGMCVSLLFGFYAYAVGAALPAGILPGPRDGVFGTLLEAFYISFFVNAVSGPALMGAQRLCDTLLDRHIDKATPQGIMAAVESVDWIGFVRFVVLKTVPFFWIPVNTLVFLLPPEYRVVVAAYLSIALGAFLACVGKRTEAGAG